MDVISFVRFRVRFRIRFIWCYTRISFHGRLEWSQALSRIVYDVGLGVEDRGREWSVVIAEINVCSGHSHLCVTIDS